MTLLIILALAGILLIIVEIIFIPGTTIVGFMGGAMSAYAVLKAYVQFGSDTGHVFLMSTIVSMGLVLFLCLHYQVWNKFANTTTSEGKAFENLDLEVTIGDKGISLSDLRPIGKAEINNKTYEVQTLGEYCPHSTALVVVEVTHHKIIVQPITQILIV